MGTGRRSERSARRYEAGRVSHVWVDETRPLLQGGRLTAWELEQLGIPHAVIADGAAASFMARGEVDLVVTGADRIAANGDTANKIGTYGLAVLAAHHGLPLVVVAPTSTLDPSLAAGDEIPIEERDGSEVTTRFAARNPAFDVTPGDLVAAIVTERGIHRTPYTASLPARDRCRSMILDDARSRDASRPRPLRVRRGDVRGAPRARVRRRADAGVERRAGASSSRLPRAT